MFRGGASIGISGGQITIGAVYRVGGELSEEINVVVTGLSDGRDRGRGFRGETSINIILNKEKLYVVGVLSCGSRCEVKDVFTCITATLV